MPHPRTSRPNNPTKKTGVELKAQRIVDRLRHYHKLGQLADRTSVAAVAEANGLSDFTIYKARAFARQYKGKKTLDALCKLRRPNGLPLHWGYIPFLLTVPCSSNAEKAERSRLQKEVETNGWTAPQLYAVIKSRFPKARRKTSGGVGGRPRKGAVGSAEYLQTLVTEAEALGRGIEQLGQAGKSGKRSARQFKSRLSSLEEAIVGLRKRIAAVKRGLTTG